MFSYFICTLFIDVRLTQQLFHEVMKGYGIGLQNMSKELHINFRQDVASININLANSRQGEIRVMIYLTYVTHNPVVPGVISNVQTDNLNHLAIDQSLSTSANTI